MVQFSHESDCPICDANQERLMFFHQEFSKVIVENSKAFSDLGIAVIAMSTVLTAMLKNPPFGTPDSQKLIGDLKMLFEESIDMVGVISHIEGQICDK